MSAYKFTRNTIFHCNTHKQSAFQIDSTPTALLQKKKQLLVYNTVKEHFELYLLLLEPENHTLSTVETSLTV